MAKILIAEDEKALNDAYVMILKRAGHTVKSALRCRGIKDHENLRTRSYIT